MIRLFCFCSGVSGLFLVALTGITVLACNCCMPCRPVSVQMVTPGGTYRVISYLSVILLSCRLPLLVGDRKIIFFLSLLTTIFFLVVAFFLPEYNLFRFFLFLGFCVRRSVPSRKISFKPGIRSNTSSSEVALRSGRTSFLPSDTAVYLHRLVNLPSYHHRLYAYDQALIHGDTRADTD